MVGYINRFVDFSSLLSDVNIGYINDKPQGNDTIDISDKSAVSNTMIYSL